MHAPTRLDRRTTLKWVLAIVGGMSVPISKLAGAQATNWQSEPPLSANKVRGYGLDPKLLDEYRPGDCWPLTLREIERRAATALCDLIIPADDLSPSASSLGVVDFLDEWISAPYPEQIQDRALVLEGLAWMDTQATGRFGRAFAELDSRQQRLICDPISHTASAPATLQQAARCFTRFRDLTATGFYTTPEGRRDLNFVGNQPSTRFDGAPVEVLSQAGVVADD